MFVEGMIILFRIAIAIFIVHEKDLLETASPSAFYSFVHSMTSHLFSVDRLINVSAIVCKRGRTFVGRMLIGVLPPFTSCHSFFSAGV
jgi:hypothetical protein